MSTFTKCTHISLIFVRPGYPYDTVIIDRVTRGIVMNGMSTDVGEE